MVKGYFHLSRFCGLLCFLGFVNESRTGAKKDFDIEVSLGLHCGWAVEGVIGSSFKIDAS